MGITENIIEPVIAFLTGFYGLVTGLTFGQAVIVAYLFSIFSIAGAWFYVYRQEENERAK